MDDADPFKEGQIETNRALEVFKELNPPYGREFALEVADRLERNGELNVCFMFYCDCYL